MTHSVYTIRSRQARTAGSEYEMTGTSISFEATEFTVHFNSKDIDLYIAKLNRLNITDPYNALGVLLTCINIWTDRFPDMYNYLINFPSYSWRLFKSLQQFGGVQMDAI